MANKGLRVVFEFVPNIVRKKLLYMERMSTHPLWREMKALALSEAVNELTDTNERLYLTETELINYFDASEGHNRRDVAEYHVPYAGVKSLRWEPAHHQLVIRADHYVICTRARVTRTEHAKNGAVVILDCYDDMPFLIRTLEARTGKKLEGDRSGEMRGNR